MPTQHNIAIETGFDLMVERKRRRIRQIDLAPLVGVYPLFISELETGRRKLTPGMIARIVEIFEDYDRRMAR